MNDSLVVREAVLGDFAAFLAMKSDPQDIRWSGFPSAPDMDRLFAWFSAQLDDSRRLIFIGLVNGEAAGYAHFLRATDSSPFDISYGIARAHRGRGLGAELLKQSTQQVVASSMKNTKVQAWIAVDNMGSNKTCTKAGFFASPELRDQQFLYPERRITQMRLWVLDTYAAAK